MEKKIYEDDIIIKLQEREEEDDDETLSLSDLPLIIHKKEEEEEEEEEEESTHRGLMEKHIIQQDFDFCCVSKESEMCAADEIFFQGQILPWRHSVGSEKDLLLQHSGSRSAPRSESMDHFYSGSGGLISSRSSSISSSHQSSSSGSSIGPKSSCRSNLLPARNQFHSHPSPSPRIHFPSKNHATNAKNRNSCARKSSSAWNIFRLGILTTPPEIAFQDLKPRFQGNNSTNSRNFGSRNSTDSNSGSISSSSSSIIISNRKKKQRSLLLGGCKCSVDAVDTVRARVVIMKRSASDSDVEALHQLERENADAMKPAKVMKKKEAAKKHLSHHRTFEWLKQLSLETGDNA
ncbi:hypothetical protein OROMI_028740 [Orobanche minor]